MHVTPFFLKCAGISFFALLAIGSGAGGQWRQQQEAVSERYRNVPPFKARLRSSIQEATALALQAGVGGLKCNPNSVIDNSTWCQTRRDYDLQMVNLRAVDGWLLFVNDKLVSDDEQRALSNAAAAAFAAAQRQALKAEEDARLKAQQAAAQAAENAKRSAAEAQRLKEERQAQLMREQADRRRIENSRPVLNSAE